MVGLKTICRNACTVEFVPKDLLSRCPQAVFSGLKNEGRGKRRTQRTIEEGRLYLIGAELNVKEPRLVSQRFASLVRSAYTANAGQQIKAQHTENEALLFYEYEQGLPQHLLTHRTVTPTDTSHIHINRPVKF
ncbi:hypothetical protein DIPPA_51126 [Diplonema papillatum]|nr:hypothetical protein DIPPA_51126 [Diplonema papillatum]